jgi:pimeloyl-ACP methyl ester carboxylesterase
MPHLALDGADLYYETQGTGPALVFAHGLGGNHMSWWQQVPFFRDRFRTITFAHRSFFPSREAADGPGPRAFVDDLVRLLDHLGVGDVRLVGQSMGGHTVMAFALRHPERVRAMVLTGTDGAYEYPELARLQPRYEATIAEYRSQGVLPGAGPRMAKEQPALHLLCQEIAGIAATDDARAAVRAIYAGMPVVRPEALAALTMPSLCIRGEEDPWFLPEMLASLVSVLPNARSVTIPACGHQPSFERAAKWNEIVREFLSQPTS